jgi:hypothetical protein
VGFRFDRLVGVTVPAHIDYLRLDVAEFGRESLGQAVIPLDLFEPAIAVANKSITVATLMAAAHVWVKLVLVTF